MDWHRKCLQAGSYAVLLAVILRLYSTGGFEKLFSFLHQPEAASVLLYLETGKIFRPAPMETVPTTNPTTVPTEPSQPIPTVPVFSGADAELVTFRDTAGITADLPALLEAALPWENTPGILLLHTHATESYTQTPEDSYTASGEYRTTDTAYNLVSIGDRVEQLLAGAGLNVVHAETLHDYPSYDGGYERSRSTVQEYLDRDPRIRLVLDLHRDAALDESGRQFSTSCWVNGRESARILLVVGTGYPRWEENMALAVKLTALLERMHPGITRGIVTRIYDYNQDLSPGALLVEVGAAGDTRQKALVAAEVLAEAVIALTGAAPGK